MCSFRHILIYLPLNLVYLVLENGTWSIKTNCKSFMTLTASEIEIISDTAILLNVYEAMVITRVANKVTTFMIRDKCMCR